ncbi:MAG: hypothetical protein J6B95_09780 [Oscillospiraceae bacterium]|nr:hypothetical protein [Oscillospiraceae bacterium]
MVKGISRQVIVVQSPDPKLFEQAIFILKDEAVNQGVTEEALLQEARKIAARPARRRRLALYGPVWACGGAMITGLVWLVTTLL